MSIKPMFSFSSGELSPLLHDNVTIEKFKKGLDTARNVMIGETGTIKSRFPTAHFKRAKLDNRAVKLFVPPNSGILTEWGHEYVRVYDFAGNLIADKAHALLESDLINMHFVPGVDIIYVFVAGKTTLLLNYSIFGASFVPTSGIFAAVLAPIIRNIAAAGVPTGYPVDYLITKVLNGEESLSTENVGTFLVPIAAGQSVTVEVEVDVSSGNIEKYDSIRVYRRPTDGGAYGFIGNSTDFFDSAGALHCKFVDLGGNADFTNRPPSLITKLGLDGDDVIDLNSSTGLIYQQRLLLTAENNEEAILTSRPGHYNNFYRDYPYDADSALSFKSGTTGKAKVLRMVENDGLIVFTTVGVYISVGLLSINNIALEKKGSWVIDELVPPLSVPGGVFFVDKKTNSVRQIIFSEDISTYQSIDHSIFNKHIFKNRRITSWAFQDGVVPIIIVTFSDGKFAIFTYNYEHQMRAWTRCDSKYPIEQFQETGEADTSFLVVNKDGIRHIEVTLPREVPSSEFVSNPESDKINLNAFMDGITTRQNLLNDSLVGSDIFLLVPVIPGEFDGPLTLTCGTSALFPVAGLGTIGTVFKFFDTVDKSEVDLVITARANDNSVTVSPSAEFPSAQVSDFRMYETFDEVVGLAHLEGESIGIMSDGYVLASPYNDQENYPTVTVTGGVATLPDGQRGAIILVGRPITADVKTLNINTVEQSPTTLESLTVNKLYIRVHETRGLYVSNEFPENKQKLTDGTSVEGMEDMNLFDVTVGNRYDKPVNERIEKTLPGSWESQGQIALRQVDPIHFEIISIIPDVEILRRSDR